MFRSRAIARRREAPARGQGQRGEQHGRWATRRTSGGSNVSPSRKVDPPFAVLVEFVTGQDRAIDGPSAMKVDIVGFRV